MVRKMTCIPSPFFLSCNFSIAHWLFYLYVKNLSKKRFTYFLMFHAFTDNKEHTRPGNMAKRGLCPTADISFPAVHIFRIFSHFGRYGARSLYRGMKNVLRFQHTSFFQQLCPLVLVDSSHTHAAVQCYTYLLSSFIMHLSALQIESLIWSFRIHDVNRHDMCS